jgi:LysR family nitrogen assimilation transcriptional regulator
MNPRHWRIFLMVAESGSLSRTAETTGIGQPGLSRIIKDLEQSFGVALFERHARGLRLTSAGEHFRRLATSLLAEIGAIGEQLRVTGDTLVGACALGMPPSLARVLTAPMLREFSTRHPDVRLRVWEAPAQWVRDGIIGRHLDLGVIAYPLAHPTLVTAPLATEQIYLIGSSSASMPQAVPVSLAAISQLPLVISSRANAIRRLLENAVERVGLQLNIVMEVDAAVAEYVRAGFGFGVLPASGLKSSYLFGEMQHAPIEGLNVTWALVWRDEAASECAERMIASIREWTQSQTAAGEWQAALARVQDGG